MTAKKKTAKKTAKKTGKALAKQVADGVLAQARPDVSLPDALLAFDAALKKVKEIRAVLHLGLVDDAVANRARRLSDAASALQSAAWTLREAAYAEADK